MSKSSKKPFVAPELMKRIIKLNEENKKEVLKIKIISSIALAIVGIVMLRFDVIGMFPLMGSFYIWLFSMKDYSKE